MMSNANPGIPDPATAAGQGHPGQRNVQFRVSASQQQQLHHHHQQLHQQQQHQQQQHETSGLVNIATKSQSSDPSYIQRSASTMALSQHGHPSHQQQPQQVHSLQYSQPNTHYNSNALSQPQSQPQQHQQRPPIPPSHQPRLHHSISAGNISVAANASRYTAQGAAAGGVGPNAAGVVPPKKKDPYATAWRTYSKIADELQLLNPDGTLYPISKEAILKYLHHQSKRIKSSNLHWYVNGLKKHQENLGFPWDEVRYDEQVVSLLKELTLHPVMMSENGDDDGHGHTYGSQPNRQRQTSSGMYNLGKMGHHYSSSSIDTTRIANLSISQPPANLSQQHQQHQAQQKQQQQQQLMHGTSYSTSLKQPHQSHQQYMMQQQQIHMQSQRIQQPPPPKPYYHSAPIQISSHHTRTPSAQELAYQSGHHQSSSPGIGGLPVDVHAMRGDSLGNPVSALTKRKRDDFGFKKRRVPSAMSIEGEDNDDDDLQDDELKDEEFDLDDRQTNDTEDFDDLEDSNRYQPLKRRASTGTLLNQARAQAVKHVPGPFALDQQVSGPHVYPKSHLRESSTGSGGSGSILHRQRGDPHLLSSSPDLRDDEYSLSRREGMTRLRDSPPDSTSSTSSVGGHHHLNDRESQHRYRQVSSGGVEASPTAASLLPPSSSSGVMGVVGSGASGKTTVQFSEVVECAQLLQAKYGNQCKEHHWGCVEITEDRHLELTMKMYLDWAGLVASGRLTMDELPDLPEFRLVHPVVGGTLKRMASTPLTSSLLTGSVRGSAASTSTSSSLRRLDTADDPAGSGGRVLFGSYRSPSSSPPSHHLLQQQHDKDLDTDESNLLDRIGSPLPRPASAQLSIPLPSPASQAGAMAATAGSFAAGGGTGPRANIIRAARKMPSTPSLSQHMRQHSPIRRLDVQQRVSGTSSLRAGHLMSHAGSIVSNSTASSPRSEEADISDEEEVEDDEEEEEEEVIDVNNYALSPWATAPSALGARAGATEKQRSSTPKPSGSTSSSQVGPQEEEDTLSNGLEGMKDQGTSAMAVDQGVEGAVSAIGEISDAPVAVEVTIISTEDVLSGGNHSGDGISVDAAAKVLDSMMIGRSTDSRTDVNAGQETHEEQRLDEKELGVFGKDGRSERGQSVQTLSQSEDSVMMET